METVGTVEDTTTAGGYFLVGKSADLVLEFPLAATGVDQMRVGVGESGNEHASMAGKDSGSFETRPVERIHSAHGGHCSAGHGNLHIGIVDVSEVLVHFRAGKTAAPLRNHAPDLAETYNKYALFHFSACLLQIQRRPRCAGSSQCPRR